MSLYSWKELLTQWNKEILESESREFLSPEVIASKWIGYPGATEPQIAQAEERLGRKLPPSYREFLKFSNGWGMTTSFIDKLWSVEEIEWYAARHQELIDAWRLGRRHYFESKPIPDTEYFIYGERQNPGIFRDEYLQTALEISDIGDSALYLLNPQVATEDGEWEAWFFASWLPGANRHRSFWELMQAEYERFLSLKDQG